MPAFRRALPRVLAREPRGTKGLPVLLVLTVALLLPPAARAQSPQGAEPSPPDSPLELLLERKAALSLTHDQVGRLEAIRQRLAASNEPLVSQMMDLRRQWQQQRRTRGGAPQNAARLQQIRAAAEPIRASIQRNNRTAMQAVNRLLTPAQRTQVRAMVQERQQTAGAARRESDAARRGSDAGRRD